jgi:hypothetical protein
MASRLVIVADIGDGNPQPVAAVFYDTASSNPRVAVYGDDGARL